MGHSMWSFLTEITQYHCTSELKPDILEDVSPRAMPNKIKQIDPLLPSFPRNAYLVWTIMLV